MSSPLFLHEEILLLALHDEKGTISHGGFYAYAIGGAILAELIVRRRVELIGPPKKRLVQLLDPKPIGEPLLDECLERVATAKRRGSPSTWVMRFAGARGLRKRMAERLCQRGILREQEKGVLLLFKRRVYPALDPKPEREIVQRLESAIFGDAPVDARTVVLLSLANSAKVLPIVFGKKAIKGRRDRIESLVSEETLGKAVKDAIETAVATMVIVTT